MDSLVVPIKRLSFSWLRIWMTVWRKKKWWNQSKRWKTQQLEFYMNEKISVLTSFQSGSPKFSSKLTEKAMKIFCNNVKSTNLQIHKSRVLNKKMKNLLKDQWKRLNLINTQKILPEVAFRTVKSLKLSAMKKDSWKKRNNNIISNNLSFSHLF